MVNIKRKNKHQITEDLRITVNCSATLPYRCIEAPNSVLPNRTLNIKILANYLQKDTLMPKEILLILFFVTYFEVLEDF